MRKILWLFLIFISELGYSQNEFAINKYSLDLNGTWKLYSMGNKEIDTILGQVPGTVHTDLFSSKIIQDPYFGNNEKDLNWITDQTWIYEKTFELTKEMASFKSIILHFKGIDTNADILINGNLVLTADNMFRSWQIPLNEYTRIGSNKIQLIFKPIKEIISAKSKELKYFLPTGQANYMRKAQFQFGWDWAPSFPTVGIWKGVSVECTNHARIENVQIISENISDTTADVRINVSLNSIDSSNFNLVLKIDTEKQILKDFIFNSRTEKYESILSIKNPKQWNCRGWGDPNLYFYELLLFCNDTLIDQFNSHFGLRTAALKQIKDDYGKSFYFEINGNAVYAKGSNWVPMDVFLPSLKPIQYERFIDFALQANFNMLRVWGGGVYETDYFYDLCDKKGIMVWQDFMFACSFYPGDSIFLNNVKEEIKEQVIRLRNHPSIVLWCGNNEINEAWHNWGYQKKYEYSFEDSVKIWNDYQTLFHELIPLVLAKEDATRSYHPSSPTYGWGRDISLNEGDQHYWGVWWGKEPFENYRHKVGRFSSEFGFQSFPNDQCFKKFISIETSDFESNEWQNHQKHPVGFETIKEYMERDFKVPSNLKDYAYVSQLLQARGMQIAIEAQRMNQPKCMGSLYWQFNDCWPAISWSSIDYFANPKAVYYAVKKAFKPNIILIENMKEEFNIHFVTDHSNEFEGELIIKLKSFKGEILFEQSQPIKIPNSNSVKLNIISKNHQRLIHKFSRNAFLQTILTKDSMIIASNVHCFEKPKNLKLDKPNYYMEWLNANELKITNNGSLLKNVYVEPIYGYWSDNYFDIIPGQSKIIKIIELDLNANDLKSEKINEFPKLRSLNDI